MNTSKKLRHTLLINSFCYFILFLLFAGCDEVKYPRLMGSSYQYFTPDYNLVGINVTGDSLHFPLQPNFYSKIKTFNTFISAGEQYISFYNRQARAICFYKVNDQHFVGIVPLQDSILGNRSDNVTTYACNFDTILVTTKRRLYMLDSSGKVKDLFELLPDEVATSSQNERDRLTTQIYLDNEKPAVFYNGVLYSSVRPAFLTSRTLSAQKRMHVMYAIDFSKRESSLLYNFPKPYWEKYLGFYFLESFYCFNSKGEFVISFAGDPNIFVTDLRNTSKEFLGKSKALTKGIVPLEREEDSTRIETDHFERNDRYGPIYADPFHKRYLRIARKAVFQDTIKLSKSDSTQFLMVFDENYKIIGESIVPKNVVLGQLFVTPNGAIYARTNRIDEYSIHFVRLEYIERASKLSGIANN